MGQYHHIVNMTARESLTPHALGCGLKEWEIVANSPGANAALIGLISIAPGNQPADLGNNPMVGRWAGHRILAVGDYAKDGDIPGFDGPPLSELYGLCEDGAPAPEPTVDTLSLRYANTNVNGHAPYSKGWRAWIREKLPEYVESWREREEHIKAGMIFPDQAKACQGMVEQGASVRFCGTGWLCAVPVRAAATAHPDGTGRYKLVHKDAETLTYYQRCGITKKDWQRPPRDGAWHGIRDSEVDVGQRRLIVNLDRHEFIDPITFGDVPTTAGMMRGEWGAGAALMLSLFHPEQRGGGDCPPDEGGWKGRWRNQRLVAVGDRNGDEIPNVDRVLAGPNWTNVTSIAMAGIAVSKAW